jgi:hypothetical protein
VLLDGRVVLTSTSVQQRLVIEGGPAGFEPGEVEDIVEALREPHPCDVVVLRD